MFSCSIFLHTVFTLMMSFLVQGPITKWPWDYGSVQGAKTDSGWG